MRLERVNQSGILGELSWREGGRKRKSLWVSGFVVVVSSRNLVPCSQD